MQYRVLGKSGLTVSVIGLGTWQYGGEWGHVYTQGEVDAIFDRARARGINLLDTAECYGDHLSEGFCGKAIARDRDQWVVATKFGHRFLGPFEREERRSAEDVRRQLEDSLRALNTDRIDLYQFHGKLGLDDEALLEELWKQQRAGKIRSLGLSLGKNDHEETERAASLGMDAIQVVYNRLDRGPEQHVLASAQSQNLGVLGRVPLASGFLSGKYDASAAFPENDVRSGRDRAQVHETIEQVRQIERNEVPANCPTARWALAWCLQHPAVTCVIPGCKSPEQADANADAAEMTDLVRADHPQAATAPAA
jgi:aryl-alcohol dehydrogenase-like predicted oxidoreductase